MRFELVTIVWGNHHVDLFLDLTLPNILSAGNIPALARDHEVVYRFFTTPESQEHIEASPAYRALAAVCRVEFNTPLGARKPDVSWHVHWFHRSAAEAKVNGAVVVFVPPDTLWTDGAFRRMGELMASGVRGIANPFVLVNSETCVPDAQALFTDPATGLITVPCREMWPLVRRHVHPLHTLATPGGRHARPAFELHWPIGKGGMISRYAVRELVCFDPARCPITFLWYPAGPEDTRGIHFVTESDEFLMLSVDPLAKYFANYIIDHSCDAFDLARTTRHPLNDTQQTRVFAPHSVRILGPETQEKAQKHIELRAVAAGRKMMVGRAAMLLHEALAASGAAHMAGLISVALLAGGLVRRWRHDQPISVIVPRDGSFDPAARAASLAMAAPGRERDLVDFLLDHVVIGRLPLDGTRETLSGISVSRSRDGQSEKINDTITPLPPKFIEGIDIYLIDRQISPRLPAIVDKTPPATTGAKSLFASVKSFLRR